MMDGRTDLVDGIGVVWLKGALAGTSIGRGRDDDIKSFAPVREGLGNASRDRTRFA